MSTSYTPGPWFIDGSTGVYDIGPQPLEYSSFRPIAKTVGVSDEEALGNARLLSAAPELLKACYSLIEQLKLYDADSFMESAVKDAEAAIAKAEGFPTRS